MAKNSTVDLSSLDKWDDYTKAKEAMFFNTDNEVRQLVRTYLK